MQYELNFSQEGPAGNEGVKPLGQRQAADHDALSTGQPPANGTKDTEASSLQRPLRESLLEEWNLRAAMAKVRSNRGAPGIDGITVKELEEHFAEHWPEIEAKIRTGRYRPKPVRRVEIPKPEGGSRTLGIPCVIDRVIQQALLQVLTPIFDPGFSEFSYGFRPGRSAHDGVRQAREIMNEGFMYVVDMDIEKFFDRVNHDILMARVYRKVKDRPVLLLIRRYLQAGALENGVRVKDETGVPQGGPLSPLLANILLDDLDRELARRGHRFVRYAGDCNIYVKSRKAGDRVMRSVTDFLWQKLKLKVNEGKSAVDIPSRRKFLGFSFWRKDGEFKIRVAPKSRDRLMERIRQLTRRRKSMSMDERIREINQYLTGWSHYFALSEAPSFLRQVMPWLRHRLNACYRHQWNRRGTRFRELKARGIERDQAALIAFSPMGRWRATQHGTVRLALNKRFYHGKMNLIDLSEAYETIREHWRTAVYGPVRTVV